MNGCTSSVRTSEGDAVWVNSFHSPYGFRDMNGKAVGAKYKLTEGLVLMFMVRFCAIEAIESL